MTWLCPSDPIGYRKVESSVNPGSIDGRKARQGRREDLLHLRVCSEAAQAGRRSGDGRALRDTGCRGESLRSSRCRVQRRARAGGGRGGARVPAQVDQPLSSSTVMLSTPHAGGPLLELSVRPFLFLPLFRGVHGREILRSLAITKAPEGQSPNPRGLQPRVGWPYSGQVCLAASLTSLTVMRPPEPVPSICERSTPRSSALRSAAGVACALSFCSPASPGVLASPTTTTAASSSSPASTPSPGSAVAGVLSYLALLRSSQTASEITMSASRTLIPSPTPLP